MEKRINGVFICHSSKEPDRSVAETLGKELQEKGFDVWWDEKGLVAGDSFPAEILEAIMRQNFFVYLLSPRSASSKWCARELSCATQLGKPVKPLVIEKVPLEQNPIELAGIQYIDISQGVGKALPEILRSLGLGDSHAQGTRDDPFSKDGRLVTLMAQQLIYGTTFTDALNLIQMLRIIGQALCETDRAKKLFAGMTLPKNNSTGGRFDYEKTSCYLIEGWKAGA